MIRVSITHIKAANGLPGRMIRLTRAAEREQPVCGFVKFGDVVINVKQAGRSVGRSCKELLIL